MQAGLGAALAVDDHPQPGLHGTERYDQAGGADGQVSQVVDAVDRAGHLGQRGGDD
jgi:hypothetical protein